MSAAPRHRVGQDADATRAMVLGIGQAVVSLDRRLRAFERLLAEAAEQDAASEAPQESPYGEAATIATRRREMHLVPAPARVRTTPPRRPPLFSVDAKEA